MLNVLIMPFIRYTSQALTAKCSSSLSFEIKNVLEIGLNIFLNKIFENTNYTKMDIKLF